MDYIKLMNRFWKLHSERRFTTAETALYFQLLDISNGLVWKNPFQQSNERLYSSLQIAEKTLMAARSRLQAVGLLSFKPGHKRYPTVYELAPYSVLFVPDHTLETAGSNLQLIPELTGSIRSSQQPNSLENAASSTNQTEVVENKTSLPHERANSLSSRNHLLSSPPQPVNTEALKLDANSSSLGDASQFEHIARQGNYGQIDFETYRLQMLATAQDQSLRMPAQSWRKWMISYLNQDRSANKLILALTGPTQHRSTGLGDLHAKANNQQPLL